MVNQAKRLLGRANQRQTVGAAALMISAAYLLSRLLGLLRDRLLVTHYGIGPVADAYNAAFRLPEMLFTLLVSGAFAVAFIPILAKHLQTEQRKQAWELTSTLLNLLVLATVGGGIIIGIFADPLTTLISPGFDPFRHQLAVNLTRIMLISPVMFAVSSVLGSVQQAFNRFLIFSLAGVFYNVGIIVGILWLSPHAGIYGVAWGVVIGVVLQALLQGLGLMGLGFRYRLQLNLRLSGVRQTLKLMLPRSIDQGIDQINFAVGTIIGSTLHEGSIAAFTYANNLKNVPLVLIASSITTAVFPRLATRAAEGARTELIETYVQTARLILFMAVPAAVFTVIGRGYLVRLLYASGSLETANTLGWFAGTIIFTSLFFLVSRIYYAMQDTRTPLYLSLASVPIDIVLSIVLARRYGVAGLAMSASIVAALETIALMVILRLRQGRFGERAIWSGAWRMGIAAAIMAPVLYLSISHLLPLYAIDRGFWVLAPKFALLLIIGLTAYLAPCYILGLKEASNIVARIKDIMVRSLNLT
ncbi:MAG TPA: murein biosynthesis integral membrane protein MurJ [Candidatus Saccharimonadia bacterium]|nr:murein biosynthesis integral membrane protein MurJ [Candidatus Saccharimonadia bacterium]